MPTETKNSTAKASRSGSVSCAARWLSVGLAQDHAGEERAERERDVEQRRGPVGDAERDRQHGEAEQLARAGMRHVMQQPRDDAPADQPHQDDEGGELAERDRERQRDAPRRSTPRALGDIGERRQRTPAPAPSRGPRRSASRPRCGRARCRAGGAPARCAAPPRCWRPTARAPKIRPAPSDQPSSQRERRRRARSRPRSARARRAPRWRAPTAARAARTAARRRTSAG